jgi:hypothetical protein
MATEQELQRRRDEEQAARVEARRQAAIGAGHLEWLKLPERRDLARHMRVDQYFTGLTCDAGHTSPKLTRTGACIACKDAPPIGRSRKPSWDWNVNQHGIGTQDTDAKGTQLWVMRAA